MILIEELKSNIYSFVNVQPFVYCHEKEYSEGKFCCTFIMIDPKQNHQTQMRHKKLFNINVNDHEYNMIDNHMKRKDQSNDFCLMIVTGSSN